jgi:hypothetical protein
VKFFRLTLEFDVDENLEVFVGGLQALDAFKNALNIQLEIVERFEMEENDGNNGDTNTIESGSDSSGE